MKGEFYIQILLSLLDGMGHADEKDTFGRYGM